MPFTILRDDITNMRVDAVVNAANEQLQMGGGVCGAIFAAAGKARLRRACGRIGGCPTGGAVITKGYKLPAKRIIHAVGPIWRGGGHGEEALLRACYLNALALARRHRLTSVAFPLISSGAYGYPKDQALSAAVSAIGSFLLENDDMQVYLVVFDEEAYRLSDKLFDSIKRYIDSRYADRALWLEERRRRHPFRPAYAGGDACTAGSLRQERLCSSEPAAMADCAPVLSAPQARLKDVVWHIEESFTQMLLRLIDESGKSDPMVYKRANLDRKLFSKIRSTPNYKPSKNTALALAVSLELDLARTTELLRRAGYALSPASRFDLIVEYFIREGNYNIFEINEALYAFCESQLGA